ncbi:hypothetical protein EYF80_036339 [Liparis tanakae]|uniref:Uncharacterized protein n=1 Tax=Liparis tanakae TaxID=230148 RepID=A0A4Z2GJH6_9TELE|nr:hypothetical protein EYF80_036339 [Liparis tanakae]
MRLKGRHTAGRGPGTQRAGAPAHSGQGPRPPAEHLLMDMWTINTKVRIEEESPESRAQNHESRVQSPDPRVQSPEARAQSPEPRALESGLQRFW